MGAEVRTGTRLFDIVDEFEVLYELAVDESVDEQTFSDTLEALMGELEVKGAGYVAVINQLDMEAQKAKEISEQFKIKAMRRTDSIARMKQALKDAMVRIGVQSIDTGDYTIKLQKNGGKQPLVIDGDVPESMCKVILEPDKDRIRAEIEDGKKLPYAHLMERGQHIVIK